MKNQRGKEEKTMGREGRMAEYHIDDIIAPLFGDLITIPVLKP